MNKFLRAHAELASTARTVVALAFAYVVTGFLAMQLAVPPGYAIAFFPPAGIAVAMLMVGGLRLLPGVILGAICLNVIVGYSSAAGLQLASLLGACAIAFGSALQAWVGSRMLKRWVKPALDSGHDIARFLLLAPLMCVISACVSVGSLFLLGIIPAAALPINGLTWWIGDTIGVLLAAPLTWVLVAHPRRLWWQRRWLLSVPLCLGCAAFIGIYMKASAWETDQQMQAFRMKSQQVGDMLQHQFSEHERVMIALASLLNENRTVSAIEFHNMARSYLDNRPELWALGWAPQVSIAERPDFERWVKANVNAKYAIHPFNAGKSVVPNGTPTQYYPVTYLEPLAVNTRAMGLDLLTEPNRAAMIEQATRRGRPTASAPVVLAQVGGKTGLLLAQTVKFSYPGNPNEARGVLLAVLQAETYLERALGGLALSAFTAQLTDVTNPHQIKMLVDAIHRPFRSGDYQKTLTLGGRQYQLLLAPTAAYLEKHHGWQSWSALVGGLLFIGLIGALMLLVSGQHAKIEAVVTDRTRALHEREARLSAILDNSAEAVLTIDRGATLASVNSAGRTLFGYSSGTMQGLALATLVQIPEDDNGAALLERLSQNLHPGCEMVGRTTDGRLFPLSIAVSLLSVNDETFFVCILHDLTERQRSQEQIYQLAHHDALTGLANRATLTRRMEHLLEVARNNHTAIALMFVDLDHFKKINDSHGQQIGDHLLAETADRLRELLRDADTVARIGNDQFIVALTNYGSSTNDLAVVAQRIISALMEPYRINDQNIHVGASVGISLFPDDGDNADTLLRNADAAMHAAKTHGRGNYQFFSADLNAAAHERLLMENRIWLGLERKEFELFLQPQIHLSSRTIIGAEALIRWHHPKLGMIAPDRFIPIAEESGLILPLGEWVLERAMHILAQWQQRSEFAHLRLAINLSARQCNSGTLIAIVDRLREETGVDLTGAEMEITETAAMQDPEQTRQLLQQLRARGIKVAIDDFGTGYSSLSYLKLFAIDRIKIDRGFVKDIENDQNDALIASATIALAHTLGLEVIAEGVETEGQCAFLNHELCDEGQGYLFGRPMPIADFEALLRKNIADNRMSLPESVQT